MQASPNPYLDKALESLAGAESEFVNERYNNTANRAYYAVFQAAIAALQRTGIHPARDEWSHEFVPAERDPYWTADTALFEGTFRYFRGSPTMVRSRIHVSEEAYRLDAADLESALITQLDGRRS